MFDFQQRVSYQCFKVDIATKCTVCARGMVWDRQTARGTDGYKNVSQDCLMPLPYGGHNNGRSIYIQQ